MVEAVVYAALEPTRGGGGGDAPAGDGEVSFHLVRTMAEGGIRGGVSAIGAGWVGRWQGGMGKKNITQRGRWVSGCAPTLY